MLDWPARTGRFRTPNPEPETARSLLAKVTNTAPNLPSRVVLYAAEKWGKSSFAAHAPKPLFLTTAGETGLLSLIEARKVPAVDHFPDDLQSWHGLGTWGWITGFSTEDGEVDLDLALIDRNAAMLPDRLADVVEGADPPGPSS